MPSNAPILRQALDLKAGSGAQSVVRRSFPPVPPPPAARR